MKNIFKKSSLLAVALFMAYSCSEDDNNVIANPSGGPTLLAPESGAEVILTPGDEAGTATTLIWDHADYAVNTEINYALQFALEGTDFASPVTSDERTDRFRFVTNGELNGWLELLGVEPFTPTNIQVRVRATLGTESMMEQFSNPITLTVTGYTTDLPRIAVPGNHQGWNPSDPAIPQLAGSAFGETDYEGYAWLDGEYKFLAPNDGGVYEWGNTDWGDDGSFSGVLAVDGESNCMASAGFYRLRANTDELVYTATPVSWGVIGAATPTGWDSDTDLTYNPDTKKLELASIALVPGPFKFRGNNEWGEFDLGTVNEDGYLVGGGDLTFDGPAGNYKIILDLSNPRRYTYQLIQL